MPLITCVFFFVSFSFLFFSFFFFFFNSGPSARRSGCVVHMNSLSLVERWLSSAPPRRVEARVRPSTPPTVTARTTARTRRSPSLSPGGAQASLWWNYSTGEIHNVEFLFFFPPSLFTLRRRWEKTWGRFRRWIRRKDWRTLWCVQEWRILEIVRLRSSCR